MPSKSLRELEQLKSLVNHFATSYDEIVRVINSQAVQITNLTKLVVSMHREVHPEAYDANGMPLGAEEFLKLAEEKQFEDNNQPNSQDA